jgi:dTDP-4-amino-4,6-dideoxygalactose transaminase
MIVPFNDLKAQWDTVKDSCVTDFDNLFTKSNFILGDAVKEFEEDFAEFVGCKYAVGVSNGTDALKLSAQALDLVGPTAFIIPANTFVATLMGIEQAYPEAVFKLVDCDEHHQMDIDMLHKTVRELQYYDNIVIVPVHLYGYTCDMESIMQVANKFSCIVLEDSSQAHGAYHGDSMVGSFGKVSAFSLYPGKNLGAAGDAGIVTTNDKDIYERLQMLRNLGSKQKYVHEIKGGNHRLDTLQAIVLKHKLPHLQDWNERRRAIVKKYESLINNPKVSLPRTPPKCTPVHHVYPVLVDDREGFMSYLNDNSIQSGIHYPILMSEMPMYSNLSRETSKANEFSKKMVSLPIHPFMSEAEVQYLCEVINKYDG